MDTGPAGLEALATPELSYRELVEHANDLIYTLDLEGHVSFANAACELLTGYTPADVLGTHWRSVVAPEDQPRVREHFEAHVRGAPPTTYEVALVAKDGRRLTVELSARPLWRDGRVVAVQGVARDITARRAAEAALRESEARFRAVVESLDEGLALTDPNDRILYLNPRLEAMTGFAGAELLGRVATEVLVAEPDREAVRERHRRHLEGRTEQYRAQLLRKDGGSFGTLISAGPLRDPQGRIIGTVGAITDLTERERLEAQLRHAQKLESIGQLAAGVAHDFNNILNVVHGYASLLLGREPGPGNLRNGLQEIVSAADRAAHLTRQLLAFSRRQILQPRAVDLNEVLSAVVKLLQRVLRENIALELNLSPGLPMIHADVGMIEQVVMNLAVNSRDAMPHGGTLTLSTLAALVGEDYARQRPEARAGQFVCLSVADSGSGMSPETMSHLFEPFFTTKPVGKGSGLGLATVYGIVKQHEGWIEVSSQAGVGSTFKVFLPGHATEPTAPAAPVSADALPRGDETLLVVEDEEALCHLARQILEGRGYRVLTAGSAEEALEVWRLERAQIRLLVTDLVLSGELQGAELAQQLRGEHPGLRVIYATGYSTEEVGEGLTLDPAVNLLLKPYSPASLTRLVRRRLDAPPP